MKLLKIDLIKKFFFSHIFGKFAFKNRVITQEFELKCNLTINLKIHSKKFQINETDIFLEKISWFFFFVF